MHTRASVTSLPLERLGVLAIDGPDAATFLQGQATCDCRLLSPQRGALGALCNLQGRMIVSFYVLAVADGLRLVMPRDRVAAILTHLKKYAVFAKVTLRDDSAACRLLGEIAAETDTTSGNDPAQEMFSVSTAGSDTHRVLQLRGGRRLHLVMNAAPATVADATPPQHDDSSWRAAAILAGELLVDTANTDRYLPQALNYDVIEGVNFRKGCYTGQEVVARMHFKGKMKERLYLLRGNAGPTPPADTVIRDGEGRSVGDVVDAVAEGDGVLVAAVVRHDAVLGGTLRLEGEGGTPLRVLPSPHDMPGLD